MSCSSLLQALDVRECVCVYGANVLSLVQSLRPLGERVAAAAAGGAGASSGAGAVEASRSTTELLMTLPCPSAQTVSKYNSQFHKLFQCVPKDEILMKGETGRTSESDAVGSFTLSRWVRKPNEGSRCVLEGAPGLQHSALERSQAKNLHFDLGNRRKLFVSPILRQKNPI